MSKGSGIYWIVPIIAAAICIVVWLYLPVSVVHNRKILATRLQWDIAAWRKDGWSSNTFNVIAKSNDALHVFLFRTNVYNDGQVQETILALSHVNFRRKGFLAGTTNAEIFWVAADGSVKKVKPAKP